MHWLIVIFHVVLFSNHWCWPVMRLTLVSHRRSCCDIALPCPALLLLLHCLPTSGMVDAPVDCYFPFHLVLIPPVLVSHPTDQCEPQAFTLWHRPALLLLLHHQLALAVVKSMLSTHWLIVIFCFVLSSSQWCWLVTCCCCHIAPLLCGGCCIHTGWLFIGRNDANAKAIWWVVGWIFKISHWLQ